MPVPRRPGEAVIEWQDAIAPLPIEYQRLCADLAGRAAADERIRAAWLHGALGRRDADAGSDLDVCLTLAADALPAFAAGWVDWLREAAPVVLSRPFGAALPGGYSLTAGGLRVDLALESAGAPATLGRRIPLCDKDNLAVAPPEPAGPDRDRVAFVVEEVLREQANFPTVVIRQDWLLGVVAVQQLHLYIYELFVQGNRPAPERGPKQWSARLTPAQRELLTALPVPSPRCDPVLDARADALHAFLTAAHPLTRRLAIPWPRRLHDAVGGLLHRHGLAVTGLGR